MAKKNPKKSKIEESNSNECKKRTQVVWLEKRDFANRKYQKKDTEVKVEEFLTEEQKKQFHKILKEYSLLSDDDLIELLTKNRQVKHGSRQKLLNRCAEGKLLGGLTNCPKCKKAKLKFSLKTGIYTCEGYMVGEKLKVCGYTSNVPHRIPWQD